MKDISRATSSIGETPDRLTHRIYDLTGGGATHDIVATDLRDAIDQGRDWIEDGEWGGRRHAPYTLQLACCVRELVYVPDLSSLELPGVLDVSLTDGVIFVQMYSDLVGFFSATTCSILERVEGLGTNEKPVYRVTLSMPIPVRVDDEATHANEAHDCSGEYISIQAYDYATDCECCQVKAHTVHEAYTKLRAKITDAMIANGATLWVEPANPDSTESRLTLGLNAE